MQELSGRDFETSADRPALLSKLVELQAERAAILCEDVSLSPDDCADAGVHAL